VKSNSQLLHQFVTTFRVSSVFLILSNVPFFRIDLEVKCPDSVKGRRCTIINSGKAVLYLWYDIQKRSMASRFGDPICSRTLIS